MRETRVRKSHQKAYPGARDRETPPEINQPASQTAAERLRVAIMMRGIDEVDGTGVVLRGLCDALFKVDRENEYIMLKPALFGTSSTMAISKTNVLGPGSFTTLKRLRGSMKYALLTVECI